MRGWITSRLHKAGAASDSALNAAAKNIAAIAMATSATSVRNGRTCRVAFFLVLCCVLFFLVSACEVLSTDAGGEKDGKTASEGDKDVKEKDGVDAQTFFDQLVDVQTQLDNFAAARREQKAKFEAVSNDAEKEWKTYVATTAGVASLGGLGVLLSHLAKRRLEDPLKDLSGLDYVRTLRETPGLETKQITASVTRAISGVIGTAAVVSFIYGLTRLALQKQERRRTQALFANNNPKMGRHLKGLLSRLAAQAYNGTQEVRVTKPRAQTTELRLPGDN